jgi:hypothetical protein
MKTCKQCGTNFEVMNIDRGFYEKWNTPEPILCPDCRHQRRYAFRNERSLYHRECVKCDKSIISIYSPDKPYIVYCNACYLGDGWNGLSHAQEFDFSRPFFEQLKELKLKIPRLALDITNAGNSDYSNISINNKNCYLVFAGADCDSCLYTRKLIKSKNCLDINFGSHLELSYECTDCHNGYQLFFSQNSTGCSSSAFLFDCSDVKNSLLCANLRHKEYHFLNEPVSKNEFQQKWSLLSSLNGIQQFKKQFEELKKKSIYKENNNINCENCVGDHLVNCKNCYNCFDLGGSEDCRYCTDAATGLSSSMDCSSVTINCEDDFECLSCSDTKFSAFCTLCRSGCSNLLYCDHCFACLDLFGCIGLRHNQYCILNKQYNKGDYKKLISKIIKHMQSTGEWGQFFTPELSIFDYNETMAQEYYPLTREQVTERGWQWCDFKQTIHSEKTIPASRLPEDIKEIPDDILNWAIICETTGKLFKITHQELQFYRQQKLPIPHDHPDERHRRRTALRTPRHFWANRCQKCQKPIQTTYSPDRAKIIYCEECYLKTIY